MDSPSSSGSRRRTLQQGQRRGRAPSSSACSTAASSPAAAIVVAGVPAERGDGGRGDISSNWASALTMAICHRTQTMMPTVIVQATMDARDTQAVRPSPRWSEGGCQEFPPGEASHPDGPDRGRGSQTSRGATSPGAAFQGGPLSRSGHRSGRADRPPSPASARVVGAGPRRTPAAPQQEAKPTSPDRPQPFRCRSNRSTRLEVRWRGGPGCPSA